MEEIRTTYYRKHLIDVAEGVSLKLSIRKTFKRPLHHHDLADTHQSTLSADLTTHGRL